MLTVVLALVARDLIEIVVTGVFVTLVMAAFGAIPFVVEYYIDDRRNSTDKS